MNPETTKPATPAPDPAAQPARRRHVPNLAAWIVAVVVVLTFAAIALPVFNSVAVRSPETKSLAQAKQIALALMIFAGDNEGRYPTQGVPATMTVALSTSNAAFACLFPTYTTSERIFGNKLSAYQTCVPDDVISPPGKILEPGENVYGYVAGFTDKSPPDSPLVVDGTDGTGHYRTDPKRRGGVWSGSAAIVIYLDNHGALEKLAGPRHARFIPRALAPPGTNLLGASSLGKEVRLLDPAVAAP